MDEIKWTGRGGVHGAINNSEVARNIHVDHDGCGTVRVLWGGDE